MVQSAGGNTPVCGFIVTEKGKEVVKPLDDKHKKFCRDNDINFIDELAPPRKILEAKAKPEKNPQNTLEEDSDDDSDPDETLPDNEYEDEQNDTLTDSEEDNSEDDD